MKLTNKQLKQIIKEEINKVLEGISTPEMVRANPQAYSKESAVLLKKLQNKEIEVSDLDQVQIEMLIQMPEAKFFVLEALVDNEIRIEKFSDAGVEAMMGMTGYLSQAAFSTGDHYRAYDTPEYKTMEEIERESEKRRKAKVNLSKSTNRLDPGYDY